MKTEKQLDGKDNLSATAEMFCLQWVAEVYCLMEYEVLENGFKLD